MKKLLIVLIALSCYSCTSIMPLKSSGFRKEPFVTDMPKEQVWINLVGFFASNGIGIKTIDKASGLIVSEGSTVLKYTHESDAGVVEDSTAAFVVQKYADMAGGFDRPYFVSAGWNVLVNESGGKTVISVNVVNIDAYVNTSSGGYGSYSRHEIRREKLKAYSTGVFEKTIFGILTNK